MGEGTINSQHVNSKNFHVFCTTILKSERSLCDHVRYHVVLRVDVREAAVGVVHREEAGVHRAAVRHAHVQRNRRDTHLRCDARYHTLLAITVVPVA